MTTPVIAYIVSEGTDRFLCVNDRDKRLNHRFPINKIGLARIAAEANGILFTDIVSDQQPELKRITRQ